MSKPTALAAAAAPFLLLAPAWGQDVGLQNGDLRFVLSAGGNVRLFVRGIPVIRESHLYIVKPGWSGHLMNQDQVPGKTSSHEENGVQVALASYDTENAWSKHRYEVHPDNTFKATVTYGIKGNQPGEAEYAAAYLNANVLHGARFTAETVEGPREGTVPMVATSESQTESLLTPLLSRIRLETRIGPIEITVEGGDDSNRAFRLFDARGGRSEWATANPVFWFGFGAPALPVNGESSVTVTYRFGDPEPRPTAPARTARPGAPLIAARAPHVPDFPVIPRPKESKYPETRFPVNDDTAIVIPDDAGQEEKVAARGLQAELRHFWGVRAEIYRAGQAPSTPRGTVIVLRQDGEPTTQAYAQGYPFPPAPGKSEGYGLVVEEQLAAVNGRDGRGVYFGAQTLKQLLRLDEDGGVYMKGARMRDWPTLEMRGVHWFGGPNSLLFHKRMIDRVVSPLKMNTMLYQADFTKWESQPNLWGDFRMTEKDDVRAAIHHARAHFMEPIPLVQGLGHSDWLFANRQNRHLAADPDKVYSFNPFLPEAYEKQFQVWQEAIELFEPVRYYHIGHDEITTGGGFPPKGTTKSNTEIIIEDILKCHAWLKERGLTPMMWGDELLHWPTEASDAGNATPEDARARREALPKDIVITDWHYAAHTEDFPSAKILQDAGFPPVVGVTWYETENIRNFAKVLARDGSLGLIQSTWAGYVMSPEIVDSPSFHQFVAYLLAAEYAWNGGGAAPDRLGYNPDDAFRHFWARTPVDRATYPGAIADIGGAANAEMWDWQTRYDAPDLRPASATRPSGAYTVRGAAVRVDRPVWLAGALNPAGAWPKSITVPLDQAPVSELVFVWGTTVRPGGDQPVARVTVTYEDGATETTQARYGTDIFAFDDTRGGSRTDVFWTGTSALGTPASARAWTWSNPHPGKAVTSVEVTSLETEAAPVVLGLTVVGPAG